VDIEVTRRNGSPHRRVIWAVVDGGDVFVRSFRGTSAVWYRAIRANPLATLHVNGEAVPVSAIAAADADSIERCSTGLRRKYRGRSLEAMVRAEVLETTLRLEARDPDT
jgi:hypothetical protein